MGDMRMPQDEAMLLARKLAGEYAEQAFVETVTLSGSRTSGAQIDALTDIDLFVYSDDGAYPLEERRAIADRLGGARQASMGLTFWGDGDVWVDARSEIEVDVVFSSKRYAEDGLNRVLRQHKPSGGYTTCLWHSVRTAQILVDRNGWFASLQAWSDQPYPPELRRAIIDHNFAVLRDIVPSYRQNVEKSLPRGDLVFINNEVMWMLASYFDVLFAVNWVAHPGAKRLLDHAARLCPRRPEALERDVRDVLRLAGVGDSAVLGAIDRLVDGLEGVIGTELGEIRGGE